MTKRQFLEFSQNIYNTAKRENRSVTEEELQKITEEERKIDNFQKRNNRNYKVETSKNENTFGKVFRELVGVETAEKRALVSSGSALIQNPQVVDDVVYSLQSSNPLVDAGVQFVNIDNNRQVPKISSYPVAAWISEGDQLIATQPTITSVKWELKDLAVLIKVQNNVLYDAAVNTERMISEVANRAINDMLLKAVFSGSGANGEPLGIDNYQNVLTVDMATDGATITDYTKHTEAVKKLLQTNNDLSKISFVQSPDVFQQVNDLQVELGNYQLPPFDYRTNRVFTSSVVKSDYQQGTTANTTRIYVADFSKLVVGVGGEIMVKLSERYADHLQTAFIVHLRVDPKPIFENSFCIIRGITTS